MFWKSLLEVGVIRRVYVVFGEKIWSVGQGSDIDFHPYI